jgi:predicted amidophosphoribosyltransferase
LSSTSLLAQLFTEATGIERYATHAIAPKIQVLSEHYAEIFGTTTGSVIVATDYSEHIAELLHRAKYIGDARVLIQTIPLLEETMKYIFELNGEMLAHTKNPPTQFVLSYVPIGLNRYIHRGFNQGRFLAKILSKKYAIPLVRIAILPWSSWHQSRRTKEDRMHNKWLRFYPNPLLSGTGKVLIIIDDVISTGATLKRLVAATSAQDWEHIIVLALARNS